MQGRDEQTAESAAPDGAGAPRLFRRLFVALAGTAVVLLTLFVVVGFGEIRRSAHEVEPGLLVLAALILALVMPPLAALRWYLIVRRCGAEIRFGPLLRSYVVSNVLNLFMPGPVGDLTVSAHLKGQEGLPVGTGFASLILAKLSMAAVNASFLALALPMLARLHLDPEVASGLTRTVLVVISALGVVALVALLPRTSIDALRSRLQGLLERLSVRAARKAGEAVEGFSASFVDCAWTTFRSPLLLLALAAISTLKTSMLVVAFLLAAEAVGLECSVWDGVFLATAYTFLLLSSTWIPGAVGPPELFLVGWSTGVAGHEAGDGVLFGLLVKMTILVGGLGSTSFLLPLGRLIRRRRADRDGAG